MDSPTVPDAGYASTRRPPAGRLDRQWLLLILLSFLLFRQDAIGRADPADWVAAKKLALDVQTAKGLSENERKPFLATFAQLQTQHDQLEADEQALIARLSADQALLKQHG